MEHSPPLPSLFVPDPIDPISRAFYVQVPRDQVVQFQGCFDLAEGLGFVRTMNQETSILAVVTTADLVESCQKFLLGLQAMFAAQGHTVTGIPVRPPEAVAELWIGATGE